MKIHKFHDNNKRKHTKTIISLYFIFQGIFARISFVHEFFIAIIRICFFWVFECRKNIIVIMIVICNPFFHIHFHVTMYLTKKNSEKVVISRNLLTLSFPHFFFCFPKNKGEDTFLRLFSNFHQHLAPFNNGLRYASP